MTKGFIVLGCWGFWVLALAGCGQQDDSRSAKRIRVAVAASAEPAISEIARQYESENDLQIEMIKGASGKLYAQILNGAPFDLFISADTSYCVRLYHAGKASLPSPPIAYGQLAMWSRHPITSDWQSVVRDPKTTKIAIANPQTAPFGQVAKQLLEDAALIELAESKLVFAESVGQVAMYIRQSAVDAAITSHSTRFILPEQQGYWLPITENPARYALPLGATIVKRGKAQQEVEAENFLQQLLTKEARKNFIKHGFKTQNVSKN